MWVKKTTFTGVPLGRLDAQICMVDLLRHLTSYYILTTPLCEGHVIATLYLLNDNDYSQEEVIEIKTYEEEGDLK